MSLDSCDLPVRGLEQQNGKQTRTPTDNETLIALEPLTKASECLSVFMTYNRAIAYSGQKINDREFEGDNVDFVDANLLYNYELSKKSRSVVADCRG